MLRKIIAIMIKEFLSLLKDKKSRMVLILPPIAQIIVFGYAASFDLTNIPYVIYNQDKGLASRELLSDFSGSKAFHLFGSIKSDHRVAKLINDEKTLMVIHIGPEFSKNLILGKPAPVQIIVDGRNSNTAMISLNYARNIIVDFNRHWAKTHSGQKPASRLIVRSWFNSTLTSHWFIIPGIIALLTLVVTLEVTALSVAREREAGTFDQLLITPVTPTQILIGKSLPGFIIGIMETTFAVLMVVFWFHIPLRGSLFALYLGLFAFLLSAVGIGLMISSLSVTQQQGLMGVFFFMVPAVILSGFATPIANMPILVQYITYLNPMRYFLIIIRSVFLQGDSFALLWPQYWPMVIIGVVSLAFAGWLFRRRMF